MCLHVQFKGRMEFFVVEEILCVFRQQSSLCFNNLIQSLTLSMLLNYWLFSVSKSKSKDYSSNEHYLMNAVKTNSINQENDFSALFKSIKILNNPVSFKSV